MSERDKAGRHLEVEETRYSEGHNSLFCYSKMLECQAC